MNKESLRMTNKATSIYQQEAKQQLAKAYTYLIITDQNQVMFTVTLGETPDGTIVNVPVVIDVGSPLVDVLETIIGDINRFQEHRRYAI